ncbi:MAG: NADH-quinone oxidoreductase subunit J [Rhodobacteraceae bacterium]|nr:NADH-quinone oxidoreductase subunit J [Paracoccaceae bacterium]
MTLTFAILAALTVVGAVAAMTLRNLVHCALSLAVSFIGLAAIYLQLGAQFIGLAQVLVYVGAVAILIVFAILLTRSGEPGPGRRFSATALMGVGIALAVFIVLGKVITSSAVAKRPSPLLFDGSQATVAKAGERLMTDYILPLEVLALLLTAAMIGAVIIALREKEEAK